MHNRWELVNYNLIGVGGGVTTIKLPRLPDKEAVLIAAGYSPPQDEVVVEIQYEAIPLYYLIRRKEDGFILMRMEKE